ncbi:MAG TPA: glycosyltransferase [Candidatus Limnocylindrales bacterium]|nr:glycosyltransferase [Candidatus Limnocylindrales bacterium]
MLFIFWVCFAVIFYVYFGYPLLLLSGLLGRRRPVLRKHLFPSLSIIIPARNEEAMIRQKLENLLSQDYPAEKMKILVGDDGSTDGTAAICQSFEPIGVSFFRSEVGRGKSALQNELVSHARGEILVFTDADCLLPQNALSVIAQNFGSEEVALVTNCATILNGDETGIVKGEGLYWKYEKWLRQEESHRGLLAMASGSLFAMRRSHWARLDPNVGDDFALPLRVAEAGYRNVLENRVSAGTQLTQNKANSMLRMKMRIISKDLYGLLRNSACLNPFRVGRVAIGLWSHKLLRWAVPYFLLGLLMSNIFLAGQGYYGVFLAAQAAFYCTAAAGLLIRGLESRFPVSATSSFCVVNFASLLGTLHCLTFGKAGQWKTVR